MSSSSAANAPALLDRKQVSWGHNTVVIIDPSYHVPEGCPKETESLLVKLMEARSMLKRSLSHSKPTSSRVAVIPIFKSIIASTEIKTDPISQTIFRVSHIFLARAYFGTFCNAFLREMEIIDRDSEMKRCYDRWRRLLTAESIFS